MFCEFICPPELANTLSLAARGTKQTNPLLALIDPQMSVTSSVRALTNTITVVVTLAYPSESLSAEGQDLAAAC